MERLSGLDASFLYLETPTLHMHVAMTLVFDPVDRPGRLLVRADEAVDRGPHPLRTGVPAATGRGALPPRPPGVGRRPRLRHRLPRAPGRRARARAGCGNWPTWPVTSPAASSTGRSPCGRCGSSRAWPAIRIGFIAKMHHSTVDGVSGAELLVGALRPRARARARSRPPRAAGGPPGPLRAGADEPGGGGPDPPAPRDDPGRGPHRTDGCSTCARCASSRGTAPPGPRRPCPCPPPAPRSTAP